METKEQVKQALVAAMAAVQSQIEAVSLLRGGEAQMTDPDVAAALSGLAAMSNICEAELDRLAARS